MPIDPTDGESPRRQPGSNLLAGNPSWQKGGPSPNAGGKTSYQRALEEAISKQETPELVCQVVAAMREDAISHEKYSPAAAKVYFAAVGLKMDGKESLPIDLSDAPPETLSYLREKLRAA